MPARLIPAVRDGIVADLGTGLSQRAIAKKYGVALRTISTYAVKLKREAPEAEFSQNIHTYKEKLTKSACAGLQDALDKEPENPSIRMKRGNLCAVTLRGTGFFQPDNQGGGILAIVNGMREHFPAEIIQLEGGAVEITPQPESAGPDQQNASTNEP